MQDGKDSKLRALISTRFSRRVPRFDWRLRGRGRGLCYRPAKAL